MDSLLRGPFQTKSRARVSHTSRQAFAVPMLPSAASVWSHRRDGPLFFSHIPRTAGTEFSELLRDMLPPPTLSAGATDRPLPCWGKSTRSGAGLFALRPVVVYGHSLPPDPRHACPDRPKYMVVTAVREPLAHLISRSKLASEICDWLRWHRPTDDMGLPTKLPSGCGRCLSRQNTNLDGCLQSEAQRQAARADCEQAHNRTAPEKWKRLGLSDEAALAQHILALARANYFGREQLEWVSSAYPGAATGARGCLGLNEGCATPQCQGFAPKAGLDAPSACPAEEVLRRANASLEAMPWVGLTERWAESACLLKRTLLAGLDDPSRFAGRNGSWWNCACAAECGRLPGSLTSSCDSDEAGLDEQGHEALPRLAGALVPRCRGQSATCCDGGAALGASIRRSTSNLLAQALRERFARSVMLRLAAHLVPEEQMYAHAVLLHERRLREAGAQCTP